MKNLQAPLIDIVNISKSNGIYTVSYWDENCEVENNVEMQISEDSLVEFIDANYATGDTDFTELYSSIESYLAENTDEVIKDYITQNS